MKQESNMQKKSRFIKRIVLEAERNLEVNLREFGTHALIIPYRKKDFLKIKEYMEEINEEAAKRKMPFKAFELKEFPGEIRFAYIYF